MAATTSLPKADGIRPLAEVVGEAKQRAVNEAIKLTGSIARAAQALQVDRSTLHRLLKEKRT